MYAKLNSGGDWRFFDDDHSPTFIRSTTDRIDYYILYGVRYYSKSEVKRIVRNEIAPLLGKTQKSILEEIGEPDKLAPNPKYAVPLPVQLYQASRIDDYIPF